MGIHGKLYDIIESYLQNRVQLVRANGFISQQNEISIGVPQGSILGPILFSLYINDLPKVTDLCHFFLYADDTAIIIKNNSWEGLQTKINLVISEIEKWFLSNRLSLNASKTNYQIYTNIRNSAAINIDVYINRTEIARCNTVKYLGVLLDEKLKWESHISNTCLKISRNIGVMGRVKYFLSSKELMLLYNSIVLSHLNYCAMVWGTNYPTNVLAIHKLQKRALRIVDKKPLFFLLMSYL